jgi:hypothetical protein
MYNADNSGYPANLAVLTTVTYFPDGPPKCPIRDEEYPSALINFRVDTALHGKPHPVP